MLEFYSDLEIKDYGPKELKQIARDSSVGLPGGKTSTTGVRVCMCVHRRVLCVVMTAQSMYMKDKSQHLGVLYRTWCQDRSGSYSDLLTLWDSVYRMHHHTRLLHGYYASEHGPSLLYRKCFIH